MHILTTTTSASLDDLAEPVDLRPDAGAISWRCPSPTATLPALAAAWQAERGRLPSMRLAALRDLRHPDVGRSLDRQRRRARQGHPGAHSRRLRMVALWLRPARRARPRRRASRSRCCPANAATRIARLIECSTLPRAELDGLLDYFREGGPANMRALVRRLAGWPARRRCCGAGRVPKAGSMMAPRRCALRAGSGLPDSPRRCARRRDLRPKCPPCDDASADLRPTRPVVPILFYRSMLLAADVAPIDALCAALARQGHRAGADLRRQPEGPGIASPSSNRRWPTSRPPPIVTATAFATGAEPGGETLFDRAGVPVFQVIVATTRREAWAGRARAAWRRPTSPCMS